MKRIICAVLAVLMLLSSAMADEFVLRNGVQFGMDISTVISLEKENGLTPKEGNISSGAEINYPQVPNLAGLSARGALSYRFSSGKLIYVQYHFPNLDSSLINSLRSSFISKYGTPAANNFDMMLKFSGYKPTAAEHYQTYLSTHAGASYVISGTQITQWLYPLDDGGAVEINFLNYKFGGEQVLYISYTYRSPKEVSTVLNTRNTAF